MTKKTKANNELRGKARLRAEIVEMTEGLNRLGMISDDELQMTTLKMLGRDKLPKVEDMTASEIIAVREKVGVSQGVLAAFLNVAVGTLSQWERGERHPKGSALKLLNVVKRNGLDVLR